MKIIAILQARMGSSRLPGKVLREILGRPMLALQIERVRRSGLIDGLIVATSDGDDDQPIADLCRRLNVPCFRGSLDDVLDRYYQAARKFDADHVVRLTGDCPLADGTVIDRAVEQHLAGGHDFTSNTLRRTWPQGLDVEVVSFESLQDAWRNAGDGFEREHVLPYIWRRPERFSLGSVVNRPDLSGKRWTVDEQADFDMIKGVYEGLYRRDPRFTTADILDFLAARPDIEKLNSGLAAAPSVSTTRKAEH